MSHATDKRGAKDWKERFLEGLRRLWNDFLFVIFLPIWIHQHVISTTLGRNYSTLSQSARQPLSEILLDFFPYRTQWQPERDMADQRDRVAIVTGGLSGIGYETSRALMRAGARVYVFVRVHQRSSKALERLRSEGKQWPGQVIVIACDISDMDSVYSAVDEFSRQEQQLHMLICNAGVLDPGVDNKTAQGYEMTLGTNVLGHHQLVQTLVPLMRETASLSSSGVRVCFISSWVHNIHQPSGFDELDAEWLKGITMRVWPGTALEINPSPFMRSVMQYGHSKFLNVCQAKKFQRLYGNTAAQSANNVKGGKIIFTSCDPGNNLTELMRDRNWLSNIVWNFFVIPVFLNHPSYGAITPLWACTASETAILGGQYLAPWARISPAATPTDSHDTQDRLYDWCEAQLKKNGF